MYRAIVRFVDLQDNNHLYQAGDIFPREGTKVSDKRLQELLSDANRRHKPMIEEFNPDKAPEENEIPTLEELEPKPNKRGRKKNVK